MSAKDWFESIPSPFDKPAATGSREPRKMVSRYSQTIHDEDGNCAGASCTPLVPTPPASPTVALDRETLAQKFHEAYERLAPQFGYRTREASAVPWADVPEQNKQLMIAVAGEVLALLRAAERQQ